MDALGPLLGRTLVLVAHQDDETIGCGALLQRARNPVVVFATDGAPRDQQFWNGLQSRSEYARERKSEALRALQIAGVQDYEFLSDYGPEVFVDQELFRRLREALDVLARMVHTARPQALLTHAYEGGHPDHDACSFIGCMLGRQFRLPVWEMPLYYRMQEPRGIQQFLQPGKGEIVLEPAPAERGKKDLMVRAYVSQTEIFREFTERKERFRPQLHYDYSRPPHDGTLNYEAWGWPIAGAEVSAAFAEFSQTRREPRSAPNTRSAIGIRRAGFP